MQHIQQHRIISNILYYTRAIADAILMVLNSLVVQHNKGVNHTMNQLTHFINYSTYHPFVEIKYYHINIILYTSSDALYIFDPEG